jgi:quercetin dioxygenase-like cupin family protein
MTAPDALPPGPFCLPDLAAYQPGAVVSRILMKQEKGTVTVFAFAEGQSLSEHTVPHDALIQVLEGEAEISIDGVVSRVAAGEAIFLPGGRPHAVTAASNFKMILTMIKG